MYWFSYRFGTLNEGFNVIVFDILANYSLESFWRVEGFTGKSILFVQAKVCDVEAFRKVFESNTISSVIHFAALKAAGE